MTRRSVYLSGKGTARRDERRSKEQVTEQKRVRNSLDDGLNLTVRAKQTLLIIKGCLPPLNKQMS